MYKFHANSETSSPKRSVEKKQLFYVWNNDISVILNKMYRCESEISLYKGRVTWNYDFYNSLKCKVLSMERFAAEPDHIFGSSPPGNSIRKLFFSKYFFNLKKIFVIKIIFIISSQLLNEQSAFYCIPAAAHVLCTLVYFYNFTQKNCP